MNLSRELERLEAGARDFLSWWRDELVAALPDALRHRFAARTTRVTIRPGRSNVEIDLVTGADGRTLRENAPLYRMDETAWLQLEELMTDAGTRVRLGDSDVFRTHLRLPAAAGRNIQAAVGVQLPLISPLRIGDIVYGWHSRTDGEGHLDVTVVIAKAATISQIEGLFNARGLETPPIEAAVADSTVVLRRGRERLWSKERRTERMSMLVAGLLLASIPVTIWAASAAAVFFSAHSLEALRMQAAPIRASARRAALADARRRAIAPLARQGLVSPVIDDLAVALPATAYLESFRYNGDEDVGFTLGGDPEGKIGEEIQNGLELLQLDREDGQESGTIEFHARVR